MDQLRGNGPNAETFLQIDPSFDAARISIRPLEYRSTDGSVVGGHFAAIATFSNTAAAPAANSTIFGARWRETRAPMVLKRLWMSIAVTTAFTTAQAVDFSAFKATGYTAPPTAGTALAANTGQRMRTNMMSPSLLLAAGADVVISSGGALTNGTRVLEANPFGYGALGATGVGVAGQFDLFNVRDFGVHPQVLGANEGFEIQNGIAFGAAGICKIAIGWIWAEAPFY